MHMNSSTDVTETTVRWERAQGGYVTESQASWVHSLYLSGGIVFLSYTPQQYCKGGFPALSLQTDSTLL